MLFCTQCGQKNAITSKFCTSCGNVFSQTMPIVKKKEFIAVSRGAILGTRKNKTLWWILGFVVIVGLAIGVYYFFKKIKNKDDNQREINLSKNQNPVDSVKAVKPLLSLNSSENSTSNQILQTGEYIANGNPDQKIYFYNQPDELTKRKAYISTQENVFVQRVEKGFGYVEFTNSNGQISYGWLRMDFLILKPN